MADAHGGWALGGRGRLGRGGWVGGQKAAWVGLAEFKRVVRVAVNFLPRVGFGCTRAAGMARWDGKGGCKGRGRARSPTPHTYLSTIFYQ